MIHWNPDAFDADLIIEEYGDMVYKIAISHTYNKMDAEDVFQETFMRLVKYRYSIKNAEHLKAWLIRVTINCCKDILLNPWRQRINELTDNIAAPEEETQDVFILAKQLPDPYKIIIHLFYYEDMSIKEISNTLQIKESTIKSQLHRGRKLLKSILMKEGIGCERSIQAGSK